MTILGFGAAKNDHENCWVAHVEDILTKLVMHAWAHRSQGFNMALIPSVRSISILYKDIFLLLL